jgi:hypothetical protein
VRREEENTSSERRNMTFSGNIRQKTYNFVTKPNKTAPELQMLKPQESQPRMDKKNLCSSTVKWDGNKMGKVISAKSSSNRSIETAGS